MPAHAPDSVTNPEQRQLYRDISRVYENYCGSDEERWPTRRLEFFEMLVLTTTTLREQLANETIEEAIRRGAVPCPRCDRILLVDTKGNVTQCNRCGDDAFVVWNLFVQTV